MYVVVMAGGAGTRLHPLSRPDRPKPFLPLVAEGETLLQRTVRRLAPIAEPGDVFVIADQRYGSLVRDQVPGARLLVEPSGKNTAAAIALATVAIERPDDEVMLVLPADHFIDPGREAAFAEILRVAADHLATGAFGIEEPLVTLGVQPTFASTEFGYLRPDTMRGERIAGLEAYPLLAFEEKPSETRARDLMNLPGIAWNAGMFAWRRGAIRAALEKFTPLMTLIATSYRSDLALAAAYERVIAISIDYAVMEGAAKDHQVVMGSMDVGWSDLGSWSALLRALDVLGGGDGAGLSGRVVQPGEPILASGDDLLLRPIGGRLVLQEPADGTIVADAVWAHLVGAGRLGPEVAGLLDRAQRQESRT